jgi:hypothetical protein
LSHQDLTKEMLNPDAIAERRISLEEADIRVANKQGHWLCHYCAKRFTNEMVFMRHVCKEKTRAQEIASPAGQAAYSFYCEWMRQKKFKTQTVEAFTNSRYYKAFVNFAKMVAKAGISKPDRYIELMVDGSITPDLWCREQCYSTYLDYMDTREKPLDQVAASIQCLMDLADSQGVEYSKIIAHLGVQGTLQLIVQRKLSPWFLFHSSTAQELIRTLTIEEKKAYDQVIKFSMWAERLQENAAIREEIKSIVREVGL